MRLEKDRYMQDSIVEKLKSLYKEINKLQILYKQLPDKKKQIAIDQLDYIAAQISLVIADYKDYYSVLYIYVLLLIFRNIAILYREQLRNIDKLIFC